jgi:S1-C subfamily serine protease
MTEKPSSSVSNKWTYAFVATLVVLIINTGIFAIAYLNTQRQLATIQTSLTDQERQLQDLQNQIDILNYINQTGLMPWPEIYNQIKHSVVLIQINIGLTNAGLASGFVYDEKGYIITNYHVVEGANTIQVTFLDGNITGASKVGEDPYSDLAVVKVNPQVTTLYPVILGKSSNLTVGEPVAAIGNPFGLSDTITAGIVSALERTLDAPGGYVIADIIQVDAAINPGNSGGPLVNLKGQVVGMNTAIITATGTFAGVGFAIPSDTITREINDLIDFGTYKHPWVGISGKDVDLAIAQDLGLENPLGFLITNVNSSSPAEEAGLQSGDVIVGIDGQLVRKLADLVVYVERNKRPEDWINLTIIRNGDEESILLQLGERK